MAEKTIANMTVKLGATTSGFNKGLDGAKKRTTSFQSQMKKLGGMIAATFAVSQISSFIKSTIELADVQLKAEAKLAQALGGRGEAYDKLKQQATDLQKVTLFGDEKTIEAQAQLALVLGDNEDAILKLTPLIQDMATSLGMDLSGAAMLVAKTLGSSTNSLTRYGIQVEGAVGSSQRLNSAVSSLNKMFGGQSVAAAQAGTGAYQQFQNVLGDLKEEIGKNMIPALNDLASASVEGLSKFNKWITKMQAQTKEQKELIDAGIITSPLDRIKKALDNTKSGGGGKGIFSDYIEGFGYLNDAVKEFESYKMEGMVDLTETVKEMAKPMGKLAKDVFPMFSFNISDVTEALSTMGDEALLLRDDLDSMMSQIMEDEEFLESDTWTEALTKRLKAVEDFSNGVKAALQDMMASVIISISEGLGKALAGAGDGIENVMATIGDSLSQLGKMFIAYGVALLAFWSAFALGPAGAIGLIAAGAALVVAGTIISTKANAMSDGSTGMSSAVGTGNANFQKVQVQGTISNDTIRISNSRGTVATNSYNGLRY